MNMHFKELKKLGNFFPEFILFFIFILISFSVINYKENFIEYVFVENLINYEGGFVRRGFFGFIALFLYETFNVNPKFFFAATYYCLYFFLIVIFFYIINFLKKENFYLTILIIISPATFFFIIFDNSALFRKEIFFILIFFIHVIFVNKVFEKKLTYKNYLLFNFYLIIIILIINILIHEFQFFLLFFHYLLNRIVLIF